MGVGGVGGILPPLVHRAASRVHEEIRDCRGIEAELAGNRNLHFFRRSLGFLKEAKHIERISRFGRRRIREGGGGLAWTEREKLLLFALVCDLWFGPLSRFNLNNFVNVAQYKMICSELSCRGSRCCRYLGILGGSLVF